MTACATACACPAATSSSMYENTRADGFGTEVRRRIMIGTYVLSAGYYDAYYLRAQKVRTLIKRDFEDCFAQGIDAILTPATPSAAFGIGEKGGADPVEMYLNDVFTVTVNMAGLPGIAVPAGLDAQGLPLGLQLIGRPFDEETLFSLGAGDRGGGGPVHAGEVVVTHGGVSSVSLMSRMPSPTLTPPLKALWWAAKGDWDKAHKIVQDEGDADAAWVHAYLHRVEGDLGNAGYWYRQAGQPVAKDSLEAEWERIAARSTVMRDSRADQRCAALSRQHFGHNGSPANLRSGSVEHRSEAHRWRHVAGSASMRIGLHVPEPCVGARCRQHDENSTTRTTCWSGWRSPAAARGRRPSPRRAAEIRRSAHARSGTRFAARQRGLCLRRVRRLGDGGLLRAEEARGARRLPRKIPDAQRRGGAQHQRRPRQPGQGARRRRQRRQGFLALARRQPVRWRDLRGFPQDRRPARLDQRLRHLQPHAFIFGEATFIALCSDLATYPIADAVAASAAVPIVFTPMVIKTYPGGCTDKPPDWLESARTDPNAPPMLKAFADALDAITTAR